MKLGRVIGTMVANVKAEGMQGLKLLVVIVPADAPLVTSMVIEVP